MKNSIYIFLCTALLLTASFLYKTDLYIQYFINKLDYVNLELVTGNFFNGIILDNLSFNKDNYGFEFEMLYIKPKFPYLAYSGFLIEKVHVSNLIGAFDIGFAFLFGQSSHIKISLMGAFG